jgi:hypothetical protein
VKKPVTQEIKREYRMAGRKEKTVLLDQSVKLTGYNRKYAVRLLPKKTDIQAAVAANGKTAVFKPEKKVMPKKQAGETGPRKGDRDSGQFNLTLIVADVFSHLDLVLQPAQQGPLPDTGEITTRRPNEYIRNP